ncbi:MAG TPA: dienelactone hydrolase family protein [Tepidiformaceae bacterium]
MPSRLQAAEQLLGDVREIRCIVQHAGEDVPGLFYLPRETDSPLPLVLIQHPATSSKDDYFVRDIAMSWAKRGWICGGIDAPLHGDRTEHDPMRVFRDREVMQQVSAQFAGEVTAVIDALAEYLPVNLDRIAYVGYSMGSMLGIRAVAEDGRFKAAAFCLIGEGGIVGNVAANDSWVRRLGTVAIRIVGKTEDEVIPRAATEALYEALAGIKDMLWLPGGHFQIGPDVVNAAGAWLLAQL